MPLMEFIQDNSIFAVFLIACLGYLIGRIRIKKISMGTAGILIVALLFGHFGITVPSIVQDIGLVCFVTAVGFIAGPNFFRNFKGYAKSFIILGIVIIGTGAVTCILTIKLFHLPTELALGLLTGALTTTPGLAAAIEATGSPLVSQGYGIAYPFGVVSVVLFVQIIPIILHSDMEKERQEYVAANVAAKQDVQKNMFRCDSRGFFGFAVAILLGVLIGKTSISLPGNAKFSLGTSGGPLLAGLLLGHFRHIGKLDLSVKNEVLSTMREFGLAMFLIGAGTKAGTGFVAILAQQGLALFAYGALMAILPMLVGYMCATKILHMNLLNTLGSVCGGMTSTPALGTLIEVTGTEDVATAYAATYPVALASVVLTCQLIGILL